MPTLTLDEFLPKARELNPDYSDDELIQAYQDRYSTPPTQTVSSAPLMTLDEFLPKARKLNPDYSDDELTAAWQEKYGARGAKEKDQGDFVRGGVTAFKQIPQTVRGLEAGAGAIGEKIAGEGGLFTALKEHGLKGYQEYSADIAKDSKPSDSVTEAYKMAKAGDPGALVDWLQYALGYGGGQALQAVATAGIGYAGGKLALQPAAQAVAGRLIAKESARLAATGMAGEQLARQAVSNVAARIGQTAALAAVAVGQEGGEIYGGLVEKAAEEDRSLTGKELAIATGATLGAGWLEFLGDKIGLDLAFGKSLASKLVSTRLGHAAAAGSLGVATEGGTEFTQTLVEEFGKGNDPFSPGSLKQAVDAAALGGVGGGAVGAVGGAMRRPEGGADEPIVTERTPDEMGMGQPVQPEVTRPRKPFQIEGPPQPGEVRGGKIYAPGEVLDVSPLPDVSPITKATSLDEAIANAVGVVQGATETAKSRAAEYARMTAKAKNETDALLENAPEKRPAVIPQILPGPEAQQPTLLNQPSPIVPGQAFTPRPEPIDDPRARLAEERARMVAERERRRLEGQMNPVSEPVSPVPAVQPTDEGPLPSQADLAYPSSKQVRDLIHEKGFHLDTPVFREYLKQAVGKEKFADLTPQELQTLAEKVQKIKAPQQPAQIQEAPPQVPLTPAEKPEKPYVPTTTIPEAQVPRSELTPEKNAEILLRAEKPQGVTQATENAEVFQNVPRGTSQVSVEEPKPIKVPPSRTERLKQQKQKMEAKQPVSGDMASSPYSDLVRAMESGVEARRRLNDLPPMQRQDATGFVESGMKPTDGNIEKWLASKGTIGYVESTVNQIKKNYKDALAVKLELDATRELSKREKVGDPYSPRKQPEPSPSEAPRVEPQSATASPERAPAPPIQEAAPTNSESRATVSPMATDRGPGSSDTAQSPPEPGRDAPQSKEFRQWFGKSKVVNEDGSPKKLFHGTNAQFKEFSEKNIIAQGGFWFAEEESFAKKFGNSVSSYYLRIENPLDLSAAEGSYSLDQWREIFSDLGVRDVIFDSALSDFDEVQHTFPELLPNKGNDLAGDGNLTEKIRSSGFDGIHAPDEVKAASGHVASGGSVWVAFSADQIRPLPNSSSPQQRGLPPSTPTEEPFSLTAPEPAKAKAKETGPEQLSIDVPKPTVGEKPIIGREATLEEAPLFSKNAQEPDAEQVALPEEPEKPAPPQSPTDILASALRQAADQIAGKKKETTLQDVGQKIGGARKDKWAERGLTLEDLNGMTGGEEAKFIVKGNIWKPDYAAMVEAGTDPKAAAIVKILYDKLAAKPAKDTPEGRRHYLTMMTHVKDVMSSVKTIADAEKIHDRIFQEKLDWGREGWRDDQKRATAHSVYKGNRDPFHVGYTERRAAEKMVAEGFPEQEAWTRRYRVVHEHHSLEDHGAGVYAKRVFESDDPWKGTFDSQEDLADRFKQAGVWTVSEKGSHRIVAYRLDEAGAKARAKELYEGKKSDESEGGKEPARPHLDELQREGEEYRNGRDVTAEDFRSAFGFRGVEFGNWAASDERQKHINQAYDALMDMADVLGIPPKAVSLNGTLGIAFGARGGGYGLAHYEPSKMVINITKLRGPGSMAHEWGHALDHYFGELDQPDAYSGKTKSASGWYNVQRYDGKNQRLKNLRPEMSAAFDRVLKALFQRDLSKAEAVRDKELELEKVKASIAANEGKTGLNDYVAMLKGREKVAGKALADLIKSDLPPGGYGKINTSYYKQAEALSGKSGDYWKRPTEMFARAFESYVFDKLGRKSDYLVHGVEPDRYSKEKGYKGNPYPAEDRPAINLAFDGLFETMQSKETDKGIALYDEREGADRETTLEQFDEGIRAGLPIGKSGLLLIDSSQQFPKPLMKQLSMRAYVRKISDSLQNIVHEIVPILQQYDWTFGEPEFIGLSPDDYYLGVNLRGPDKMIMNPWGALWTTQQHVRNGKIAEGQTQETTAAIMLETVLHELTHQQVQTKHKDGDPAAEVFDRMLYRNHVILGENRLDRLQRQLMAVLTGGPDGSLTHLAKDLNAQLPFWTGGNQILSETRASTPKPTPSFNRRNVAGEGARGRTGPPTYLRGGGERQASTLDESPGLQRSGSDVNATGTIDPPIARERLKESKASLRPYLLGALGLEQLSQVYGKDHAEVRAYNKATQDMEADFTEMSRESDVVARAWTDLKIPVADKMAQVMEDARFLNFDPDHRKKQEADSVKKQELVTRFDQLPDDAKAVYRMARDFYANMAEQRFQALKERIERAGGTPENTRRLVDRLQLAYEQVRSKVYFPFTRFGENIVVAKQMKDGKEVDREVHAFESVAEAQKFATMMKLKGWTVKQTVAREYSVDKEGPASKIVRQMHDIIKELGQGQQGLPGVMNLEDQLLDSLNQSFLQALPDMSYAKHFIHAKDVKGASRDALRSFAHSALHGAHHISRIRHADKVTQALMGLDEKINETTEGDTTEARQVYNELVKRHNDIMNPNTHPVSAWLGQLGFTMSLGGVVATGITNATQVPLVTYPWLGARYGFGKASAALARAYKDFLNPRTLNKDSLFDASKSKLISESERKMLMELARRGRIDLTQTMDLAGLSAQDNLSRKAKLTGTLNEKVTRMLGFTFHAPEVMNRQVTALSTFRLEKEKGGSFEEALQRAEQAIIDTHFLYQSFNRPRYMSGNFLRVLTQFKQYSQNIAYTYGRAAAIWLDRNGATKEERTVAKRQLISMLALQFGAAGALGMPFFGSAADVLMAVVGAFGDDDDKREWEVALRKWLDGTATSLAEAFIDDKEKAGAVGKKLAEVVSHGGSRLTPWDMAGRLGQNDLFFREPQREREGRQAVMDWMLALGGPVPSYGVNFLLGMGDVAKGVTELNAGFFMRGVEELTPAVLRNGVKSLRYTLEGVRTRDEYKQLDLDTSEQLGQAFGFTPARVAEMYESTTAVKNKEHRILNEQKSLKNRFARAVDDQDDAAKQRILEDIRGFNERNPIFAISSNTLNRSLKARRQREAGMERGMYLPPRRRALLEEGDFGDF